MPENVEVKPRRPRHRHDDEVARDEVQGEEKTGLSVRVILSFGMMIIGVIMAVGYSAVAFDNGTTVPTSELETLLKALGEVFKIILTTNADQ